MEHKQLLYTVWMLCLVAVVCVALNMFILFPSFKKIFIPSSIEKELVHEQDLVSSRDQ